MIYTCYEMIRDCREDRAEGWLYFVANYVPVIRKLLAHYAAPGPAPMERMLLAVRNPQSSLFSSLEPAPERPFIAELRQKILGELEFPAPAIELDLETAAAAFAPLTMTEKQAVWTEAMGYAPQDAGAMLRMAPATVAKIRERAAGMLRAAVDSWGREMLAENGPELGRAAARAGGPGCLPSKAFLDILDGRTTWSGREELERHVSGCAHCIDHFCRMAEVIELLRGVEPLPDSEAAAYHHLLGIAPAKKGWRKFAY